MTCAELLDRYTDLRDGLITAPRELRRFERHLASCPACRRYDAAVRRGVRALQTVETIEPSPEFRRRLEARLAQERRALVQVPASARSEEHTSELQSQSNLVCRLLLEKKKTSTVYLACLAS